MSAQPIAHVEDEPGGPVYLAGQLLIRFKPDATEAQLRDGVKRGSLDLIKHINTPAMKAANQPGITRMWTRQTVRQAMQALKSHPAIEYIEPNWIYTHQDIADPFFENGGLWGMYGDTDLFQTPMPSRINKFGTHAASVWAAGYTGSSEVVVGVIDEGVQYNHPDLAANVDYDLSRNFIDSPSSQNIYTEGSDDHGTHVAGTIGAVANGMGVVGINWNVKIVSGKFLGAQGGNTADAIEAVDYFTGLKASELNVVALNNSWAGGGYSQGLHDAIIRAAKAGILFVAAAGNGDRYGRAVNNDRTPDYPANYDTTVATSTERTPASYNSVIAVTAIDKSGVKASWANYGAKKVHLGAPGVDITSTIPKDSYGTYSGTSMATPHVTGAIALYASMHPGASAQQIRQAILTSTTATASLAGKTVTGGRLDVSKLIPASSPPQAPTVTVSEGINQITLSWNTSDTADSYSIYRGESSGTYSTIASGLTVTSYLDTDVVGGKAYCYVVSAVNPKGDGLSSEILATPLTPPDPPNAPTGLTANASSRQIVLTWTTSSKNEDGFSIERSSDNADFAQIGTVGAGVQSCSNSGLSRNTTYYYRIRAYNAGGNSDYSNTASAKTPRY